MRKREIEDEKKGQEEKEKALMPTSTRLFADQTSQIGPPT